MSYASFSTAFCGTGNGTNIDPISGLPLPQKTRQLTDQDDVTKLVSSIVNPMTQSLLSPYGLKAHSVTWEDTARSKGSCWGPNISDMTLVTKTGERLMPVIRPDNFSDKTDDVPIETFKLLVGNERSGSERKVIGLREFLTDISLYTDNTHHIDLTDTRDDVVLTSSQCCVLPVRKGQKTEFAVQMFNYQSYDEDPAVLTILVSKDGVSAQVLGRSNEKLFFNDNGTARWLNVERLQDQRERKTGKPQKKVQSFTEMKAEEKMENVLMVIQVPLERKQKVRKRGFDMSAAMCFSDSFGGEESCMMAAGCAAPVFRSMTLESTRVKGAGMDMGMLGLGSSEGEYVGTKDLELKRDTRFPIRVTFQYYRATDENFISEHDAKDIATQIKQAEKIAVASGSLVFSDPVSSVPKAFPMEKTDTDEKKGTIVPDVFPYDPDHPKNKPRATEPDLAHPKPTDNPFGKLSERDYLKQAATQATQGWGSQSMSGFM